MNRDRSALRVAVVTQEDAFVIPDNIEKVIALPRVEVVQIVVVDTKGSLVRRKSYFAQGFGLGQSLRMAALLYRARLMDFLDQACRWRLWQRKQSLRAVAGKWRVPFRVVRDIHDADLMTEFGRLNLDVLVSFSAPCVFKPQLLEIPKQGCINLHCSLLPKYAGLMPSFWVLFHRESVTGASVHFMDSEIDNGAILAQEKVSIQPGASIFKLVARTKQVGGELVCRVLEQMRDGRPIVSRPNPDAERSYFTWPTVEQMRAFRAAGGRLV